MNDVAKRARVAGGLYLLSLIPGFFSLRYVPDALIASGNPGASIANIRASETLFRAGVVGELVGMVLWVLVVLALERLLADVDPGQARLMVALGLMTVPILFVNVLSELAVLTMLGSPTLGAAFSPRQLEELVGLLLQTHAQGFTIAAVFWGLWLVPFGILVWRSGFLPKALGALLAIGALGYLVPSLTALLAPSSSPVVEPIASIAAAVGELPIIFWLVVMGAKARPKAGGDTFAAASAPGTG
jgi:hypothetical protein